MLSDLLRTLPRNYSHPLPLPEVESYLRDTIYDPYIRRLVWEGILGKWQDELEGWLVCPSSSSSTRRQRPQPASTWQTVLSLFSSAAKDGSGEGGGLGVDDDTLCPYAWAKPIHELNCQVVFPKELDIAPLSRLSAPPHALHASDEGCSCGDAEEDAYDALMARKPRKSPYLELYTADYAGLIKEQWIIEKLLTQAGVRLGAVLNWIFAELDEDEMGRRYVTL